MEPVAELREIGCCPDWKRGLSDPIEKRRHAPDCPWAARTWASVAGRFVDRLFDLLEREE